jgi:acyl-CoA synthetase (AMP-forming)/AMP-acid ligase II
MDHRTERPCRLYATACNADISSLRLAFCGSAPLPLELYKKFEAAAGVTILRRLRIDRSHLSGSINPPEGEKKVGSIGCPSLYPRAHHRRTKTYKDTTFLSR